MNADSPTRWYDPRPRASLRHHRRALAGPLAAAAAAAVAAAAGCAADQGNEFNDGCVMQLDVGATAEVGQTVEARGAIARLGQGVGPERYTWTVLQQDGTALDVEVDAADPGRARFVPTTAGEHFVGLSGDVDGGPCVSDNATVTAWPPDAPAVAYRLRVVPAASHPAVETEVTLSLKGADFTHPDILLQPGIAVTGTVLASGNPVAGYVRATVSATAGGAPRMTETFADDTGQFTLRLPDVPHDVLIVPTDEAVAPIVLAQRMPGTLAGAQALPADAVVVGSVVDAAGAPVAGARVSLRIAGAPSTVGVTDAAGAFAVRARPGPGPVTVDVAPPDGLGLPRLTAPDVGGGLPGTVQVRYAAVAQARAVAVDVVDAAGSAAPGARVTWVSRDIPGAGEVSADGGAAVAMTGVARAVAVADGGGVMSAVLAGWIYDVIVEPAGGQGVDAGAAVAVVDVSEGVPGPGGLALAPAAHIDGRAVSADGDAVAGVRVSATPRGALAHAVTAAVTVETGDNGVFSLPVVGQASYDVVMDSPDGRHGRVRTTWTAPAAGETAVQGDVALPAALRLSGRVVLPVGTPGQPSGISLSVVRADADAGAPAASEGVTGASGAFSMPVPYP